MPAEKGFPGANVAIGGINSFDFCLHWMSQEWIKVSQIPLRGFIIHKGIQEVSSIERRGENNIFPKHLLDLISWQTFSNFIKNTSFYLIFFKSHWLLLNVHTFINPSFSKNVLLNWPIHIEIFETFNIGARTRFPLWGRNNLNHSIIFLVKFVHFFHKLVEIFELFHGRSDDRTFTDLNLR